jgi:hypothetical protein
MISLNVQQGQYWEVLSDTYHYPIVLSTNQCHQQQYVIQKNINPRHNGRYLLIVLVLICIVNSC